MKKLSKTVNLLVAMAALCAFVVPSMASAASWGVVGTEHTLDSPDIGYTQTTGFGSTTASCTSTSFTANVASAANLEITAANFGGVCIANFGGQICDMTLVPTGLPWTATAVTTSNIQIHGINIAQRFDQPAAGTCPALLIALGFNFTITGTLSGGLWTGNGANQHEITFTNAEGLLQHSALGTSLLTLRGTLRDTSQSLTVS